MARGGRPTEGALLVAGAKARSLAMRPKRHGTGSTAFRSESQHRFMATYHRDNDDDAWIFVKGAPERVLDMCRHPAPGHDGEKPIDIDYWRRMATDTARTGASPGAWLAGGRRRQESGSLSPMSNTAFVLLALVGMMDPPREEAIQAVGECHRAGIRVKMITGDHAETAKAIGTAFGHQHQQNQP